MTTGNNNNNNNLEINNISARQKSGRLSPVFLGLGSASPKQEEDYIERMILRDLVLLGVRTSPKFGK